MRGSSLARRVTLVVAAALVVALVAAAAVTVMVVRRPLPQHGGSLELAALTDEVQVARDERGVPQIFASNDLDLFRAQGYVHAQDRFFEMDYRRHVTAGRVSELVGENPTAQAADAVIRTFGWRQVAERELELLDPTTRSYLEAYAEGVNAYLRTREASELGVEYTVLGMRTTLKEIERWDPVDSLAWLKAMAWDLRGNYDEELARAAALRPVAGHPQRVEELFPDYPYDAHRPIVTDPAAVVATASTGAIDADGAAATGAAATGADSVTAGLPAGDGRAVERSAALAAVDAARTVLDAVPALLGEGQGVGSNSFVVSGEHTASGAPLLANDPHLSVSAPGVWYQVGLRCTELSESCTFDVAGFGFAGMPGVVIGHNAELAWGLTNMGADVTDFYLERLYEDGTYLYDGERHQLDRRVETIEVNGADPVTLTVRSTRHGPIISEVLPETAAAGGLPVPAGSPPAGFSGYAVALAWTALEPGRSMDAVFAINRAGTPAELRAAARLLDGPAQNIVFATRAGDIGYQAPGKIPVRRPVPDASVPADGSWPRLGWDSRYDWQGYLPREALPGVVNPEEGFIVAANQAVMPPGQGPLLTTDWDYGYRSERIRALLEGAIGAGERIDVDAANAIMLDARNPYAEALVPVLLQIQVEDPFVAEAVDLLRAWSAEGFPQSADSAAAAYFAAVWANVLELTFADELPSSQAPDGGSRWLAVVSQLLDDPQNAWWDDRTTVDQVEGRDLILTTALERARQQLTNSLGKDASRWEWGRVHEVNLRHPVLGGEEVPALVRGFVNPDPVAVGGSSGVVNATSWDAGARSDDAVADEEGDLEAVAPAEEERDGRPVFEVTAAPSMRMVVDLGDLDASTWVNLTGSSGHPASPHYADQLAAWAHGETFPWPFSRDAVAEATADRLELRPAG